AADGAICPGVSGCLYARPADRTDTFNNVAPRITLSWQPGERSLLYLSGSTGFRPPEMTELYHLQRLQSSADLDSEQLDALETGWKYQAGNFSLNTALFAMEKNNVILRESNGFFVSNGSTTHRGFEYDARVLLNSMFTISLAGTYARHKYAFTRAVEGGETIIDGNDVDTAPRHVHTLSLDARFNEQFSAALDLFYVGKYFLDAGNTATYPGHEVFNLRLGWTPRDDLRASLRIDNVFDTAYADRADFAFGDYRYFPARPRALFLSFDYTTQ
ncbi:MAG TPA: TonB-dependent receptor, partial [Steroidobacteraceae bacterium]|nr:TonB-dependent receptor [Steroidobacteraceae bacterium]